MFRTTISRLLTILLIWRNIGGGNLEKLDAQPRMTNGHIVPKTNPPSYMLQLMFSIPHPTFICGATLIHPQWALTAAHCVELNQNPQMYALHISSTTLYGGHVLFIDYIAIHPQYARLMKKTIDNDIAMLRLQAPVAGDPAKLPTSEAQVGSKMKIMGWGNGGCEKQDNQRDVGTFRELEEGEVTVVTVNNDSGTIELQMEHPGLACHGDSGGPLLQNNVVYGVTSTGPHEQPNYTSVARNKQFILDNLEKIKSYPAPPSSKLNTIVVSDELYDRFVNCTSQ